MIEVVNSALIPLAYDIAVHEGGCGGAIQRVVLLGGDPAEGTIDNLYPDRAYCLRVRAMSGSDVVYIRLPRIDEYGVEGTYTFILRLQREISVEYAGAVPVRSAMAYEDMLSRNPYEHARRLGHSLSPTDIPQHTGSYSVEIYIYTDITTPPIRLFEPHIRIDWRGGAWRVGDTPVGARISKRGYHIIGEGVVINLFTLNFKLPDEVWSLP